MAGTARLTAAQAARYDAMMIRLERRFFPDTRGWICSRAEGRTLEVAIGTGLNLEHYPKTVQLTGVDHNAAALAVAADRARRQGRSVALTEADLTALPFPEEHFDTVVGTFVLCEVADVNSALHELARVLRPGGHLLLADHVRATTSWVRVGQRLLESITIPASGEHFTRRPSQHLPAAGLAVVASDRFAHGAIERLHATKPAP